ncbi:MAG: S1 RNA-binding domain-containing protein, partial [Phycisphaerales bacterium]
DDRAGLPTIEDILRELEKPGRDPRQEFRVPQFAEGVHQMTDLREGMVLEGVVTNVTRFGAFVDIGVHQDGLVHISQLSDHFVKDPAEVVKVHQKVMVTVMAVDLNKKRISLSMKDPEKPAAPAKPAAASRQGPAARKPAPAGKSGPAPKTSSGPKQPPAAQPNSVPGPTAGGVKLKWTELW